MFHLDVVTENVVFRKGTEGNKKVQLLVIPACLKNKVTTAGN